MSSDKSKQESNDQDKRPLDPVKSEWGQASDDHFGYASEEERLAKRGLEDWELVDRISESQRGVPVWFIAVIVMVLLVAIGLSFPFWGDRPGYERDWVNWGFGAAIVYVLIFGTFVYFMVNLYGSRWAGRLNSDPDSKHEEKDAASGKKDAGDAP
ncbi:MAG: hypothetical protein RBT81_01145 [Gammaproteobacteria bacterium]|jgi:hypothetical protein|nr:hypothetical protein [Gammaproteobacteria bacterium]